MEKQLANTINCSIYHDNCRVIIIGTISISIPNSIPK